MNKPSSEKRIERARHFFAEELRAVAGIGDEAIVRAFATVPREKFLGPGPWQVPGIGGFAQPGTASFAAWQTPDDDPVHAYHNVLIAIDPARGLNNGHPEFWATLFDAIAIRPGETVLHIGAGVGYYTAIQAELAGPTGHVTAIEIDPELARRARDNLADRPNVTLLTGDGAALSPAPAPGQVDVIIVNAGVTHPLPAWLDALRPNGRMLLPLTTDRADGIVLRIERHDENFAARSISGVRIYPCAGARDPAAERALIRALARGGAHFIRSLRRDPHAPCATCFLHGELACVSVEAVKARGAAPGPR